MPNDQYVQSTKNIVAFFMVLLPVITIAAIITRGNVQAKVSQSPFVALASRKVYHYWYIWSAVARAAMGVSSFLGILWGAGLVHINPAAGWSLVVVSFIVFCLCVGLPYIVGNTYECVQRHKLIAGGELKDDSRLAAIIADYLSRPNADPGFKVEAFLADARDPSKGGYITVTCQGRVTTLSTSLDVRRVMYRLSAVRELDADAPWIGQITYPVSGERRPALPRVHTTEDTIAN